MPASAFVPTRIVLIKPADPSLQEFGHMLTAGVHQSVLLKQSLMKRKVRHPIHPALRPDFTTGLSAFSLRCLGSKLNKINKGDADAKRGGCSTGSHVPSLHLYALHSFGVLRLQERGYATKVADRALWISTALGSIAPETQYLSPQHPGLKFWELLGGVLQSTPC